MDVKSGRVLYKKNENVINSIASTTKIMTAIVAIENGDLKSPVKISKRAANIGGSTIDLKTSETLTLRELLYGMLLASGNDAAIAVAEHIGGSVDGFVTMMNQKAEDLGLKSTGFRNPHGLDADGHHSTAYELACLAKYALSNPVFSEIVKTSKANIPSRFLHNTNNLLDSYPGADGVKTGYTGKAGRCLVASATKGDLRIISVVLNCQTIDKRTKSSTSILNYVFHNYTPRKLLDKHKIFKTLEVSKGRQKYVSVVPVDEVAMPLTDNEFGVIKTEVALPEGIKSPVAANIEIGEVKYTVNGMVVGSSALKTAVEVSRKDMIDYGLQLLKEWYRVVMQPRQL